MEFLRMNYPDEYQHALRIQKMAEMLENQLKHAKSKVKQTAILPQR